MLGWEENGLTTSKLRGFENEKFAIFVNFRDRIFCHGRITIDRVLWTDYQARKELIYAFRDAVAGNLSNIVIVLEWN
jgi:hypothetical protein